MKQFVFVVVSCCIFLHAVSQSCPQNIDFERGDFTNWQCAVGVTYASNGNNVIDLQPSAPVPGRHEIISAGANGSIPLDEYGKFPKLCPYGGKYSVKLGNNNSGAEAEGMSYTFTVPATEDTFSFTYFYAVVFENPHHAIEEQPRFFVTAYEVETGALINCASYNYVSTGGISGFLETEESQDILYKNWSPASIQFVNLANKQVRLEFKTADCTQGGHFGYAYVDVGSGCSNILATAPYWKETNSLLLNAPYGFQYYTWYNETYTQVLGHDQNLTLSPPPITAGKFYVDLEPYPGYGCRDTAYALVVPLPVPDTPVAKTNYFYCQNAPADVLTATPAINCDLLWYTDTAAQGSKPPPVLSTAQPGIFSYYVSQKVLFGCESFKKKIIVRVDPVPVTSFTVNQSTQCEKDNQFVFTSTSTNLKNASFAWNFGDAGAGDTTATTTHSYKKYGSFTVALKITNGPLCFAIANDNVKIIPKPVADFKYPAILCANETQVLLNDQSLVPQGLSAITDWQWQINGINNTLQNPAPFVDNTPGDLPVSLVVSTAEGCVSDTNSRILKVHYQPKALFSYDAPLCDNKTIHFSNQSFLPAEAAGENISTWLWQMDNAAVSTQNPAYNFTAGIHHATLTAQSNFGCSSQPADSIFEIFP